MSVLLDVCVYVYVYWYAYVCLYHLQPCRFELYITNIYSIILILILIRQRIIYRIT